MLVDPGSINWWAVLVAATVGFAIAGPHRSGGALKSMAARFVLTLVIATVLALVVVRFGAVNWIEGALIGFVLSVGLVAASALSDVAFSGSGMTPHAIQVGYKLASFTAMGSILGAWR